MALGLEISEEGRFALTRIRPQGDSVAKKQRKTEANKVTPRVQQMKSYS